MKERKEAVLPVGSRERPVIDGLRLGHVLLAGIIVDKYHRIGRELSETRSEEKESESLRQSFASLFSSTRRCLPVAEENVSPSEWRMI